MEVVLVPKLMGLRVYWERAGMSFRASFPLPSG